MSQLNFQKAKDAEVSWINAQIVIREGQLDAKRMNIDNEPMDGELKGAIKFGFLIIFFFCS